MYPGWLERQQRRLKIYCKVRTFILGFSVVSYFLGIWFITSMAQVGLLQSPT